MNLFRPDFIFSAIKHPRQKAFQFQFVKNNNSKNEKQQQQQTRKTNKQQQEIKGKHWKPNPCKKGVPLDRFILAQCQQYAQLKQASM